MAGWTPGSWVPKAGVQPVGCGWPAAHSTGSPLPQWPKLDGTKPCPSTPDNPHTRRRPGGSVQDFAQRNPCSGFHARNAGHSALKQEGRPPAPSCPQHSVDKQKAPSTHVQTAPVAHFLIAKHFDCKRLLSLPGQKRPAKSGPAWLRPARQGPAATATVAAATAPPVTVPASVPGSALLRRWRPCPGCPGAPPAPHGGGPGCRTRAAPTGWCRPGCRRPACRRPWVAAR